MNPALQKNWDMCPRRGKRPGANPESNDACGWGSSKMETLSQWHHERTLQLWQFLNPLNGLVTCNILLMPCCTADAVLQSSSSWEVGPC